MPMPIIIAATAARAVRRRRVVGIALLALMTGPQLLVACTRYMVY